MFAQALVTEQLLEIYDKIEVEPKSILFPWEPNTKFSYSSKLTVSFPDSCIVLMSCFILLVMLLFLKSSSSNDDDDDFQFRFKTSNF